MKQETEDGFKQKIKECLMQRKAEEQAKIEDILTRLGKYCTRLGKYCHSEKSPITVKVSPRKGLEFSFDAPCDKLKDPACVKLLAEDLNDMLPIENMCFGFSVSTEADDTDETPCSPDDPEEDSNDGEKAGPDDDAIVLEPKDEEDEPS